MAERTAIVTGAGGGIGRATALRLAGEGCRVHALDLHADNLAATLDRIAATGGRATGHVHDLRDEVALAALVDGLPTVDVLVNNAGIFGVKPFPDLSAEDFRASFETNLVAIAVLCRLVARRMPKGGRIVNVASRAALGGRNMAHYVASKAAVVGLTRAMALDLAEQEITVNAVAPGAVDTAMVASRQDIDAASLVALQPIRRIGTPDDIAHAIAFLASPHSGYITGQTLLVDGGRSIGAFGI